jgi:glutathione S-transferase
MLHYTALVTCLAILFYFFTTIQVSKARVAFDIKAPTISGNPDSSGCFACR